MVNYLLLKFALFKEFFFIKLLSKYLEDLNKLEKITSLLGLGEVKGIKVEVYEYINKYNITSTNAEFTFYCDNGKVKILKELPYRRSDDELYIIFYNDKDEEINIYDLDEEVYEKIEEFEDLIREYMYDLPELAEVVIEELSKDKSIYYLDLKIDLNKFKKEEREVLKKALKILEVA